MERVAILTLPLRNNYGGVLQAYALQQALKEVGFGADILNTGILSHRKGIKYFLSLVKCRLKGIDKLNVHFSSFINEELELSYKIKSNSGFYKNEIGEYTSFIVGSDQVWRRSYIHKYQDYFLSFVGDNKRKISYAASFGNFEYENKVEISEIKDLLSDFDSISVREIEGQNYIKQNFGIDSEVVLDPTFLLSAESYSRLIDKRCGSKNCEGKVFTYVLDNNDEKKNLSKRIANKLNLDLEVLDVADSYIEIENWLSAFKTAEFVITDSFHGVVFSLIFNKQFIALGNVKRGISRFNTVLKTFSLENKLITKFSVSEEELLKIMSPIDFDKVNTVCAERKSSSISFLKKSLETL